MRKLIIFGGLLFTISLALASTHISDTGISTDKIYVDKIEVSDYIKVRGETLAKTCDIVVARDPNQAADIYCLDDDCSDEIQSAIDYVTSKGGGTVCIRAGGYPVNTPVTPKDNVVIYLINSKITAPAGFISLANNVTNFKLLGIGNPIIECGVNYICINFGGGYKKENIEVGYITIKGSLIGIWCGSSSPEEWTWCRNAYFHDIVVINATEYGLRSYAFENVTIERVTVMGTQKYECLFFTSNGNIPTYSKNLIIRDSKLMFCGTNGIDATGVENILITNNIILNVTRAGIILEPLSERGRVIIYGNIIRSAGWNCIRFTGTAQYAIVSNNLCENTTYNYDPTWFPSEAVIFGCPDDGIISNNVIIGGYRGIHCPSGSDRAIIVGNRINVSEIGIYVYSWDGVDNWGNHTIANNIIIAGVAGIYLNAAAGNIIVNNKIIAPEEYQYYGGVSLYNYQDDRIYTTLPDPTSAYISTFNGRTITYYNGTVYFRCTFVNGAWKCVQLS